MSRIRSQLAKITDAIDAVLNDDGNVGQAFAATIRERLRDDPRPDAEVMGEFLGCSPAEAERRWQQHHDRLPAWMRDRIADARGRLDEVDAPIPGV